MTRPRVAVIGATGFLGTNLVRALADDASYSVRAAGLAGSDRRWVTGVADEVLDADVTAPADVDRAVAGCEVVFLVAADTSFWRRYRARQTRINVDGPVVVGGACLRAGVRRVVLTATTDTVGFDPSGTAVDESFDRYNLTGRVHYADTKRRGLQRLMALRPRGLEVVAVHPGNILGPYDSTLQWGRLFLDLRAGRVPPGVPMGTAPFAHSTEVARAHVAAARVGRDGQSYLTAGVTATWRELFEGIAALTGATAPHWDIPKPMFLAYGHLQELLSAITGRAPLVDAGQALLMSSPIRYDSSLAVRELGFRLAPLEEQLADAHRWYTDHGYYTTEVPA